jgi:hypothetical protein
MKKYYMISDLRVFTKRDNNCAKVPVPSDCFFFRERVKGLHVNILEESRVPFTHRNQPEGHCWGTKGKKKGNKLKLK